jgi:hypothetical protein
MVNYGGGSSITTPVSVPNGGTGAASLAAYAVVTGGTTATNQVQQVGTLGNAGNPLVSGGPGAVPDFGALATVTIALADGASIEVNAAAGNQFTVTLGGNRTMAAPTNPLDGQVLIFELKQDATGSRTVTWTAGAGGYAFGTGAAPTLTTTAGATDYVGFRYSAIVGKWCFMGAETLGFS